MPFKEFSTACHKEGVTSKKKQDTKWLTDNSVSLHQSNGECTTPNAVSAKHRLQTEDEGQTESTMQTEDYGSMQTRF